MLKRLGQIELAICIVLLAVITGLVFVAAITRFFGYPLVWSVDLAQEPAPARDPPICGAGGAQAAP